MEDVARMQRPQGLHHLDEDSPNDGFLHHPAFLLVLDNLLVEVPVVKELHDDAQTRGGVLKEGLFVTDYAAVPTQPHAHQSEKVICHTKPILTRMRPRYEPRSERFLFLLSSVCPFSPAEGTLRREQVAKVRLPTFFRA